MSKEVKHKPCPYVDCGSSDAFGYNTDGYGKCFSCGRSYPSKEKVFDWAKEEYPVNSDFKENDNYYKGSDKGFGSSNNGQFLNYRGITNKTMEMYGVKTYPGDDDKGGSQEYVYPSGGIKVRRYPEKKFFAKNNFKGDELFGMNLFTPASAKIITITEGELDAMSVHQMITSGSYINPVVSVPSATPSKQFWENCSTYINSFEKIVLSVDNDEAGDALADRISKMFPNKVYRIDHGQFKDANDFLRNGKAADFKTAWWNARKYTPENILNSTEDFLKLFRDTPEHQYIPTGIQDLDDKLMGLMVGHFTVIKAETGIGKTEVMRYLEYNLIQREVPFASWHLEETKLRSLLGLVSYELKDNLTRRDLIEYKDKTEEVEKAIGVITSKETFYQFYLMDGQGADELIEQIRYFSQVCGCKFVFFEPIQDVISGQTEDSKEALLADLAVRLSKLAAELNIGIVTIAHTNENGDIKYCKMIGQRASVILKLTRDKNSEDEDERNTTHITIEKNRPCSEEGFGGKMRFNPDTFTLRQVF